MTPVENRRYHNTGAAYVLPNDEAEWERLDMQAAAIAEMLGGRPFLASCYVGSAPAKAVDVGCGTGVATLQLATLLRSTTIYGVDISAVPESIKRISPKNIEWVEGNILSSDNIKSIGPGPAIFEPCNLDYFFGRMLFLGIEDWTRYFSVAHRSLKKDGIVEHQDLDWSFYSIGTEQCLSDDWDWHRRLMAAVGISGLSRFSGSNAAPLMKQVVGSQTMAHYVHTRLLPNYPELLRKLYKRTAISDDELQKLTQDCMRDLSRTDGIYQKYTVTIGVKG